MKIDVSRETKRRLDTVRVFEYYGFKPDRKGFVCCPFHSEKTPSMKVYKGEGGFHCFGCGAHGDIFTFVQQLFGLSFPEALKKIDMDFSLGLCGAHSFEDIRRSHYKNMAEQAERAKIQRKNDALEAEYWKAFDEWKRLDDNRRIYKPKNETDELHPLFVESLHKLELQRYILECLNFKRCENDVRGKH